MRDESAGWTVGARRGPRTGRGQPGAARGGLQEPARARPGLRGQIPAQPERAPAGLSFAPPRVTQNPTAVSLAFPTLIAAPDLYALKMVRESGIRCGRVPNMVKNRAGSDDTV